MPSWHDLPAELKLMVLEHFVNGLLRIPLEDDSWFSLQLENSQRFFLVRREHDSQVCSRRPMTDAARDRVAQQFRAQHYEDLRQESLVTLHRRGSRLDCLPVKRATISFLVIAPEMREQLIAALERQREEVTPSFRGTLYTAYDRSSVCQCNGAQCGFVTNLLKWLTR